MKTPDNQKGRAGQGREGQGRWYGAGADVPECWWPEQMQQESPPECGTGKPQCCWEPREQVV